jgi:hypothetical protein
MGTPTAMGGDVQQSRVDLQVSKNFWKFASPVVFGRCTCFSSHAHQGRVLQVTSASSKARDFLKKQKWEQ